MSSCLLSHYLFLFTFSIFYMQVNRNGTKHYSLILLWYKCMALTFKSEHLFQSQWQSWKYYKQKKGIIHKSKDVFSVLLFEIKEKKNPNLAAQQHVKGHFLFFLFFLYHQENLKMNCPAPMDVGVIIHLPPPDCSRTDHSITTQH